MERRQPGRLIAVCLAEFATQLAGMTDALAPGRADTGDVDMLAGDDEADIIRDRLMRRRQFQPEFFQVGIDPAGHRRQAISKIASTSAATPRGRDRKSTRLNSSH